MYANPFVLPTSEYQRDINILKHYADDQAAHLALVTKRPLAECQAFVRKAVSPGGQFALKDPRVVCLHRGENGDREQIETTLSKYIGEAIKDRDLIAPTFTTYLHPTVKKSVLVDFIDANVKARSVAKKAMFAAELAGDLGVMAFKKTEQTNRKLSNNSISGAHLSPGTPLINRTAHSTLTSNCRSTSGYGNANNEKFLCGNRHYRTQAVLRNNIVSIVNHTNYEELSAVVQEYGIHLPTVRETLECIHYSAKHYWSDKKGWARIERLVETLTPLQRAAFMYTGDIYHLRKYNEGLVRNLIDGIATRIPTPHPDPGPALKAVPEDHLHLAAMLCPNELKGTKGMIDIKGTPAEGIVAATAVHIGAVLTQYSSLIRALWVTKNVPASVAYFPDSVRHAAITSDTDSTIFTVQDWVLWHQGKIGFDSKCSAVAAVMIFLAAQTITHVLARMSANFGIEEERLFQIAMKNEFKFETFVPTQVAKHYYALISAQEGNWKKELEMEVKGVHLKSSNAPVVVMKAAKKMMQSIMEDTIAGKPIRIREILTQIADIERDVVRTIKEGSTEYFRKAQIKTADSYTKDETMSPYATYVMWEEVFAPKYGSVPHPPYMCVKTSTMLDSPAKAKAWIEEMKDRELADRLSSWLVRNKRKHFGTTFMIPEQCVESRGIPPEILDAVGVRKLVLDTTRVFYLVLESLGIYMLNKKSTRLVSDHY